MNPSFLCQRAASAQEGGVYSSRWHANNFSGLRLILSVVVVFSHSFTLVGAESSEPLVRLSRLQATMGQFAVGLFFCLSGMVVTASLLSSPSIAVFLRKRVFRIYPGFAVALFFSLWLATEFSPAVSWAPPSFGAIRNFGSALLTLSSAPLNGNSIFPDNPVPGFANGSLWSVRREFLCYLVVLTLALLKVLQSRIAMLVAFVVVATANAYVSSQNTLFYFSILHCWTLFHGGVCALLWRAELGRIPAAAIISTVGILVTCWIPGFFLPCLPFFGALLLQRVGTLPQAGLLRWCDKHDLSYGVYLYSYPIQQSLISSGLGTSVSSLFSLSLLGTAACALLSWYGIEKPSLRFAKQRSSLQGERGRNESRFRNNPIG